MFLKVTSHTLNASPGWVTGRAERTRPHKGIELGLQEGRICWEQKCALEDRDVHMATAGKEEQVQRSLCTASLPWELYMVWVLLPTPRKPLLYTPARFCSFLCLCSRQEDRLLKGWTSQQLGTACVYSVKWNRRTHRLCQWEFLRIRAQPYSWMVECLNWADSAHNRSASLSTATITSQATAGSSSGYNLIWRIRDAYTIIKRRFLFLG
jgi:hypothetical protein